MLGRSELLEPKSVFSSQDVAKLTGVSLRQLQWWDEQGVVTPEHRSHRRLYCRFEVLQVALIIGLRNKGISLQKIRGVMKNVSEQNGTDYLSLDGHGGDLYLLTDGKRVYLENTLEDIVRVVRDSEFPVVAVCVSDLIRRLDAYSGWPKPVQSATSSTGTEPQSVKKAS